MRVFISHASQDNEAVKALGEALRARGIDAWIDDWEIGPGADFVAHINRGLAACGAGIIVLSDAAAGSRWVDAELNYLVWARVEQDKLLIPVVLDAGVFMPPLLQPYVRRPITDIDAIADALLHRRPGPATPLGTPSGHRINVQVALRRAGDGKIEVTLDIDGTRHGAATLPGLSYELAHAQNGFLQGPVYGPRREVRAADRTTQEAALADLGRHLGTLCFPDDTGAALAALIDGCPVGALVEVTFAADDPILLGLAFEAARLPDGRVLALQPKVVTLRRPLTAPKHTARAPLALPLKILLAVAAPEAASGGGPLLDYEQETQNVLDAVQEAQRLENCEVRILELGHPAPIGDAFSRDAYHVLHLSCHGGPGVLELEDEDGKPCRTWPSAAAAPAPEAGKPGPPTLLEPIATTGKPLPLVLLNACHGGVGAGDTASFAQALLAGGVPAVLAMQAPVSDRYAIRLADAFYRALAKGEHLRPSLALAQARRQIEAERQAAINSGAPGSETQPEYATAALLVAGTEQPLADFHLPKVPLHETPVHVVGGVVPQLSLGDLIGRRREQRAALAVLRDPARHQAGVVLTGIGGIGKSALAGRIMCRLAEQGWLVPAVPGKFELTKIAIAIGTELVVKDPGSNLAEALLNPNLPDPVRAQLLARVLATGSVLLVLDDFEQNLTVGGDAFLDPDTQEAVGTLAAQAGVGRLLITCRYPLPGLDEQFHPIALPPLSPAEMRKKLLRLPALKKYLEAGTALPRGVTGGHPRVLEFLDSLLRNGPERESPVTHRLRALAVAHGVDPDRPPTDLDEAAELALALAGRDVLLPELLAIVRREGFESALLQAAVSNLPVTAAGLARMLVGDAPGDATAVETALARLANLSLVYRDATGAALVHRWTAEGLRLTGDDTAFRNRCERAAIYRMWRVNNESHALDDGVEALRNLLAGMAFDLAADLALELLSVLSNAQQSMTVASLAAEVLETLPGDHPAFAQIADAEAMAHLTLGRTDRALQRYKSLLARNENLTRAEPDRAKYRRELAVSYQRIGDLYRALGQGKAAQEAYGKLVAIFECLSSDEPDRTDYQRDLSASCQRMGDLYRALGQGETARECYLKSLAISERLARAEPDRADYQRDLSVSYERMGDLYGTLGQGEAAREVDTKALDIRERLARAEPDRADYQRDLSVSYERIGDLYRALGQGEAAREVYTKALAIRERLARAEPDRADYRRDLSVAHERMGDIHRALGENDAVRDAYARALAIREYVASAEPDRADYQRDLAVSYGKMGDLYFSLGQTEAADSVYSKALKIHERLVHAEPDRADYQRDLAVSHERMGDLLDTLNDSSAARTSFEASLAIRERLAQSEPDRADYQRDLAVSHDRTGQRLMSLGEPGQAREAFERSLQIIERLSQAQPGRTDYQRDLSILFTRLGDVFDSLGETVRAREAYKSALEIRGSLAQNEPNRPDYQRDLAISLVRYATAEDEQARARDLLRAQHILISLRDSKRLTPPDARMLENVERLLTAGSRAAPAASDRQHSGGNSILDRVLSFVRGTIGGQP